MIYKSTGLSVGNTLRNGLPDRDLVGQIVPARISRQLLYETRSVRTNIDFNSHN